MWFLAMYLALFSAVFPSQAQAQSSATAGDGAYRRGDYAAAAALFQQACNDGHATGCFNLGVLYDNGRGVAKDETRAAGLYQQACTGGDATGCTNLGVDYERGEGVAKNTARALQLYRRALSLHPSSELADRIRASIIFLSAAPARQKSKRKH